VRRTRLVGSQAELWPNWRHHAFVTNLDASATDTDRHHQPHTRGNDPHTHTGEDDTDTSRRLVEADRYHRSHAVCELAIRDLKGSGGLAHLPSGIFNANAAWLLCAALASPVSCSPTKRY